MLENDSLATQLILSTTFDSHRVYSASEVQELDRYTIENEPISSVDLMERAGQRIADHFLALFRERFDEGKRVVILCGPGNNGGDGLVITRLLAEEGLSVTPVLFSVSDYSDDFHTNVKRLNLARSTPYVYQGTETDVCGIGCEAISSSDFSKLLRDAVVIDAVFGTGSRVELGGDFLAVGKILRNLQGTLQCYAIDLPTGVDPNTGAIDEYAYEAERTFCIGYLKQGLLQYPARNICGVVEVIDIDLLDSVKPRYRVRSESECCRDLPAFGGDDHKGSRGRVLVIGGSEHMPGAPALTARAALRAGAGLVSVMLPDLSQRSAQFSDECTLVPLKHSHRHFEVMHLVDIEEQISGFHAVALGPGIGNESDSFVCELLELLDNRRLRLVIDADALNTVSRQSLKLSETTIITPHPGEAGRLLGVSTETIQQDRYRALEQLREKYQCTVLLKGAPTLIGGSDIGWVNPTGNALLSTAGSGDVLTGLIATALARGLASVDAACFSAYFHGLIADLLGEKCPAPVIAGDLIEMIPEAYSFLSKARI